MIGMVTGVGMSELAIFVQQNTGLLLLVLVIVNVYHVTSIKDLREDIRELTLNARKREMCDEIHKEVNRRLQALEEADG
jgi:hypothetical protein